MSGLQWFYNLALCFQYIIRHSLNSHRNSPFLDRNIHVRLVKILLFKTLFPQDDYKMLSRAPFHQPYFIFDLCNSITRYHIVTKFCTCHDSTAVVPCEKFHCDHFTTMWMRSGWILHGILIAVKVIPEMGPWPQYVNQSIFPTKSFSSFHFSNNRLPPVSCSRPYDGLALTLDPKLTCISTRRFLNYRFMRT